MQDYTVNMAMKPVITAFFDVSKNTISYAVCDPITKSCAVIDSVMDIDYASGRITNDNADRIVDYITKNELTLEWIIETHVHADHLSAAPYLQDKLGGRIGISARITEVQEVFGKIFNEGTDFQRDGTQFDTLFQDGDHYKIGDIDAFVMATPGHTPACMVHVIGNAAFVGDTMFMPDAGSARADFPGGDAGELYDSIQKILTLPDEMRLYMCHDYGPNDRGIAWETTIAEQRDQNIHITGGVTRQDFVKLRNERDASLMMPKLLIPSLQVNMRASEVPEDADGRPVFKVPLNQM